MIFCLAHGCLGNRKHSNMNVSLVLAWMFLKLDALETNDCFRMESGRLFFVLRVVVQGLGFENTGESDGTKMENLIQTGLLGMRFDEELRGRGL